MPVARVRVHHDGGFTASAPFMSVFESYCPTLGKRIRLVPGESSWSVVCLDCGNGCTGSTCPIGGVASAVMVHRLMRSGRATTPEPIAGECPECGARTIHDVIVERFAICRACGAARRWSEVRAR